MTCALCGRGAATTRHHLVPRSRRRNERDRFGPRTGLCRDCHRMVHATFDNKRLAREYPTLDALRRAPELQAFLRWIRKRPADTYYGGRDRKS